MFFAFQVHYERGVWCHIERGRKTNWRVDLLGRGFVGSFMLETLQNWGELYRFCPFEGNTYLELETEDRGKFANTEAFTCLLLHQVSVHVRVTEVECTYADMRCFVTFTTAVFLRAELLRLCVSRQCMTTWIYPLWLAQIASWPP